MSVKLQGNCFKVSVILIFMLFFQVAKSQTDFSEVDKKFEAAKKELGGKAAILIYKGDKIVYQKWMGEEFNSKTQAPIGSCSQWLTAALVMSFVDQGKLALDDKVSKYIPIFTKYSKGYITIRDCLAHLTGIESEPGHGFSLFGSKKFKTLEEEVDDFASKKEILANPGLEFRYSNAGLNIAGRILEVITKRSFDQLMQERITRPLMMRNTSFSSFSAVNPSAGAVSTASDYMNFLVMILNKGMFNGKRILSEKAVIDMQTVRTTPAMIKYAPKAVAGNSYGLGEWILEADENGVGNLLACPGLVGTWPMIDKCRGYACIFFTKGTLGEERKDVYMDIKNSIDAQIPTMCK
jgi:CubicO group peptidase (beta-lactamase class C family)